MFVPHICAQNKKYLIFKDVQIILLPFFEIPHGDRLTKNVKKHHVQVIPRSTSKWVGIYANTNNAIGSPFQANQQQKQLVKYVPDRVLCKQQKNFACFFFLFRYFRSLKMPHIIGWFFSYCHEDCVYIPTNDFPIISFIQKYLL